MVTQFHEIQQATVNDDMLKPEAISLPFNCDCLTGEFVPARDLESPQERQGLWLLIQKQCLVVFENGTGADWRLPQGALPAGLDGRVEDVVYLGTYQGTPCWAGALGADTVLPPGLRPESLLPSQTRLAEDVLSLGGLALQLVTWQATSRFCPQCGERTNPIAGERGKKCPGCGYEHYPHLHPAIIVLVRDGERVLLTRKSFWPKGRYGLVAGFVDQGESLEGAVRREVREEVGVQIRDLTYITSQYWPYPSQLMVGFTAAYAGGGVRVNHEELEDARWFSVHGLPNLPPKLSIARFLLDHYACP
jgi:NAD+ diphosphatase